MWSRSLNLPATKFAMRAGAAAREPQQVPGLTTALFQWQARERAADDQPYVLHDGPPFANSHKLHMGHLVNKGVWEDGRRGGGMARGLTRGGF